MWKCGNLTVVGLAVMVSSAVASEPRIRTDLYGDPLPAGAVARLGSLRFFHGREIESLSFSADGKRLLSTTSPEWGMFNRLWDAETGREIALPEGARSTPLVFVGNELFACILREKSPRLVKPDEIRKSDKPATAHQILPDGRVSIQPDNRRLGRKAGQVDLHFFDLTTGTELSEPVLLSNQGWMGKISANGRIAAFNGYYGLELVDVKNRRVIHPKPVNLYSASLNPDGSILATTGWVAGKPVRLWDTKTMTEMHRLDMPPEVPVDSIAFSPDGRRLAIGLGPGLPEVWIWDLKSREIVLKFPTTSYSARGLAFSPDGKRLACVENTAITLWDAETGEAVHDYGHGDRVSELEFTPDGKSIVTGSSILDPTVRRWNVLTGRQLAKFPVPSSGLKALTIDIATGQLTTLSTNLRLLPDGKIAFIGQPPGGVSLFDPATGKATPWIATGGQFIYGFDLLPGGRVVTITESGVVQVWDQGTGLEEYRFSTLPSAEDVKLASSIWPITVSPDGRTLAVFFVLDHSGDFYDPLLKEPVLALYEIPTGQQRGILPGHGYEISEMLFSPDSSLLVTASEDRTALVWDIYGMHGTVSIDSDMSLGTAWENLAADSETAFAAVRRLIAGGSESVELLSHRLPSAQPIDEEAFKRAIEDLSGPTFAVREQATRVLGSAGKRARPSLLRALESNPSPEAVRRLERLVHDDRSNRYLPAELRDLRGTEVLERLALSADADVKREASEALHRLRETDD